MHYQCLEQYLVVLTEEGAVSIVTCPDAACKEHGRIADEEVGLARKELSEVSDNSSEILYVRTNRVVKCDVIKNLFWEFLIFFFIFRKSIKNNVRRLKTD